MRKTDKILSLFPITLQYGGENDMRRKDLTNFSDEQINDWCEQVITKFNMTDIKRIIDRLNYRRDWIIDYYNKNDY